MIYEQLSGETENPVYNKNIYTCIINLGCMITKGQRWYFMWNERGGCSIFELHLIIIWYACSSQSFEEMREEITSIVL